MTTRIPYALKDAYGYQHCHGEDCDEFFFRPLIMGKEMFTYVAHLPPGGGLHGDEEESKNFEQSLFVLSGTLTVTLGKGMPHEVETTHIVNTHEAFSCGRGEPWGKWNMGDVPLSYVCTFTWLPPAGTPEEFLEMARKRGSQHIFTPDEMNELAGDFLKE